MRYVVWFDEVDPQVAPRLGGKCASLVELTSSGLPVPPGFAVTTDAFNAVAAVYEDRARQLLAGCDPDDPAELRGTSARLREMVEYAPVPRQIRRSVAEAYARLCERHGGSDLPVAVRSSATLEDSPDASFAGEHDTYLWVRGEAKVFAAVRRCWSSLYTERSIAYRHRMGLLLEPVAMSVAVQKMVRPEASGVAFTLDPHNGDRSQIAIDASWGFGEAVVGGEVTPDNYLVDKVLFEITRRRVADKAVEYRLAADGRGVELVSTPTERRTEPCLSDSEIAEVARAARRAEEHYGCPQDVEWAIEGGHVVLLQSRPETVWSRRPAAPVSAGAPSGYRSIASTLTAAPPLAELGGNRFPSAFSVAPPPGAEGWQDLYSYSALFSEERRDTEDATFWFHDAVHWPTALPPWDATFFEYAIAALSQYNTRHYVIPPALGIDYRILNGYAYLAPLAVTDPATVEARVPEFLERAGHYYANWDDLYARWLTKIQELIGRIEAVRFDPLPEREDMAVIAEARGTGAGLTLVSNYHTLLDLCLTLWMHHFEFLNLGYAAYLDLFGFCKRAFPDVPEQAVAKMVAGVDTDLYRPDDELKKLARLAVDLELDGVFADADRPDLVEGRLRESPVGVAWLAAWNDASHPWFAFSTGSGFYHTDRAWNERHEIPYAFIRDYAARLRRGEDLARPVAELRAERDRIVAEYSALLPTDADRDAFADKLGLARVVFPYVENHNFYVEHWAHSAVWGRMRELGRLLVRYGFLTDEDDVFYLKRNEIPDVLWDLYSGWAVSAASRGPGYWPAEIRRRRDIIRALNRWSPPPALGVPPEAVTEPFTVMLWGITSESIAGWLSTGEDDDPHRLAGTAAAPGRAEGRARVIVSPAQINEVRDGEVLVAPLTAPSWAPIFGRIAATVTDVGGMMSHAAIVCREYGLPAVTGTAFATRRIITGQLLLVDGDNGTVTILD